MKLLRGAVVAGTLAVLVFAVPASAVAVPWQNAKEVVLPKGATGIPNGFLPSLACTSAGNCVAAGDYSASSGAVQGLIVGETNGVWAPPISIQPPVGAGPNPAVTIYGVSCSVAGNCAAVGDYEDAARNIVPLTVNEDGGTWQRARALVLPKNALVNGQAGELRDVVCSAPNNCSAVGEYFDDYRAYPRSEGFVATEVRGRWSAASEVTMAKRTNFNPFVSLLPARLRVGGQLCRGWLVHRRQRRHPGPPRRSGARRVAPGRCARAPLVGERLRRRDPQRGDVPGQSSAAFWTFYSSTGAEEALATMGATAPGRARMSSRCPPTRREPPRLSLWLRRDRLRGGGNCSVGGQYQDAAGDYEGFLENEVDGIWQPPRAVAAERQRVEPARTAASSRSRARAWAAAEASGAYLDGTGRYQASSSPRSTASGRPASRSRSPLAASTVGVDGGIYSLVCPTATSSCTGTGSYLINATTYEGFTVAT